MKTLEVSAYQDRCLRQNIHANLFLGGAKAGSKSWTADLLAVQHCELNAEDAHVLIIRLTYAGAEEMKHNLHEILRVKYQEDPRRFWNGSSNEFRLKGRGRIEIGYLNHVDDLLRYRGRSYSMIIFDEVADIPPVLVNQLRAEIRARKGVVTRIVATANPARPYHSVWKPYAMRTPWEVFKEDDTNLPWINCPASITDNPFLDHEAVIQQIMKDPNAAALISGDWNLVSADAHFHGAFSETRSIVENWTHLPEYGWRYMIYSDHGGGSSPSTFLYTATALEGTTCPAGTFYPKNSIVVFDEYDDSHGRESGDWNSTYGLSIERNCEEVVRIANNWNMQAVGRIDPQVTQDHGSEERLIDIYHKNGFRCQPWKKHSRANAAAVVREYFHHAQPADRRKGAGLYFTERAQGCIETIPTLPTSKHDPNVPATKGVPDHHYDAIKACVWERSQEWKRTELHRGVMVA